MATDPLRPGRSGPSTAKRRVDGGADSPPRPDARSDGASRPKDKDDYARKAKGKDPLDGEVKSDVSVPLFHALQQAIAQISAGGDKKQVVLQAAKQVVTNPSLHAAARHAVQASKTQEPNWEIARGLLRTGEAVGGVKGKRLVAAAIRGAQKGTFAGATAEVARTAQKLRGPARFVASASGVTEEVGTKSALDGLLRALSDEGSPQVMLLTHAVHLAARVTSAFLSKRAAAKAEQSAAAEQASSGNLGFEVRED